MITNIKKMTDLQRLGLDVYNGNVQKYSNEKGEDVLRQAITDACGGTWSFYNFLDNKGKVFSILSETLTIATGSISQDAFSEFVEIRDTELGDTVKFMVEDNSLFRVATIGAGDNDLRRQKLYGRSIPITTDVYGVKIYTELEQFMAGRINWKNMIDRVAKSYNHKVAMKIYDAIYNSYNDLKAPYQIHGNYSDEKLRDAIAHVKASTGQEVKIYGTNKALSKIIGADKALISEEKKSQLNSFGHYKDFEGTPMIELPQGHKAGTDEFAINDDFLLIVPDGEKIVKLLFEGEALVYMKEDIDSRNDQQMEYFFARKMGLGVLKSNIYSIYKIQ